MSLEYLNPIKYQIKTKQKWMAEVRKRTKKFDKNLGVGAEYANFQSQDARNLDDLGEKEVLPRNKLDWLDSLPPETESLSRLPYIDRFMIGNDMPSKKYDILPGELKSEKFIVQFDMSNPCSRLIILHRQAGQSYRDLDEMDKRELLRVAMACTHYYGFCDTFLSLPLGANDQSGVIYPTFYAYIIIPDIKRYLNVFRKFSYEAKIPSWPSFLWVTPLWRPDTDPNKNPDCFGDSVYYNAELYPNRDIHRLRRRKVLIPCPIPKDSVSPSDICDDFEMIVPPRENIVGVYSNEFTRRRLNALEKCQFLDFMMKKLARYLKKRPKCKCVIKITLASPIMVKNVLNVIGLMKFESNLPSIFRRNDSIEEISFLEAVELKPSTNDRKMITDVDSRSDSLKMLPRKAEYWVFIDDKTLEQKILRLKFLVLPEVLVTKTFPDNVLEDLRTIFTRILCFRCFSGHRRLKRISQES